LPLHSATGKGHVNRTASPFRKLVARVPLAFIPAGIVLCINIILNPHVLTLRGMNNLSLQIVTLALAVMAQTLVVLVRELDMSIGAVVCLTTVVVAGTMGTLHLFSLILALTVAGLFGLFAGLIVAYVKIPGIVVTLATSMIIGGLALVIMPQPGGTVDEIVGRLVNDQPLLIPNSFLILLFVMAVWKYLKNARLGRALYAAGGNPFSAYASGLSVEGAKIAAYVGSALLAAVAGIVVCGKTMTGDATIGGPYTLSSIAGTVLGGASFMGGVGTMKGAVAGALILGVLVNILFFLGFSSHYQNIVEGIILLASVVISVFANREGRD
jgi:ribose transport system permease protein